MLNNSSCELPFNEQQFINVAIAKAVVSSTSILVCSTTLAFILLLKQWKVFSQKLIIYLFISAILQSIGYLLNKIDFQGQTSESYSRFCMFSGFLTQITTWMFQGSIFVITIYLFFLIVINYDTAKFEVVYVIGIFVLPLVINWVPFINQAYHRAGLWCWIRSFDDTNCEKNVFGEFLEFFLYLAPIYLVLTIGSVLYLIIFVHIFVKIKKSAYTNDHAKRVQLKLLRSELFSLVAYPVTFFVLNIPIIANRIQGVQKPTEPSLFLWYLASIFGPLQGIVTAITFIIGTKWWQNFSFAKLKASLVKEKTIENYDFDNAAISDSLGTTMQHFRSSYSNYNREESERRLEDTDERRLEDTEPELITPLASDTSYSSWSMHENERV